MFREVYGRAIATLVGRLGDIELAEDLLQDAFLTALERWPESGVPPSPAGWILTTARHRAIDRARREATRDARHREAMRLLEADPAPEETSVPDERLQLMFTCCHPALAPSAQVALTLRLLGGLTTAEIARAFVVWEITMAQRLVRAKSKIRDAHIPYRIPDANELPTRLHSVRAVVYLIFNEGYVASSGDDLSRPDLCTEAIRLGRLLLELVPEDPEGMGLLAMMLLAESRKRARASEAGELVPLPEQDRTRWDRQLIAEGQALVLRCLTINEPGPYQLQAAIQAVHSDASSAASTDWPQIVALYDHLLAIAPTPVAALNRAVAVAEVEGPLAALSLVDGLALNDYYLFHAIRADLLARLGRNAEARLAYGEAIARTDNQRERAHLERNAQRLISD